MLASLFVAVAGLGDGVRMKDEAAAE